MDKPDDVAGRIGALIAAEPDLPDWLRRALERVAAEPPLHSLPPEAAEDETDYVYPH